tara:strand:+ start:627 stop:1466 length:840 start_codon:yes stop_codon:yes gene_type:complete
MINQSSNKRKIGTFSLRLIKKIDNIFFFSLIKNILKVYRIKKQKTKFKNTFKNLNSNFSYTQTNFFKKNINNEISILCDKYGSDKGYIDFNKPTPFGWKPHSYSEIYFDLFNYKKDEIKLVFECGIGSNNSSIDNNMTISGKPGASLRVWNDYFKNAQIFGADIDKNILFSEDRIKTFHVDQLEEDSIKNLWDKINEDNFDVIIDDGLHSYEGNLTMFLNSFHKLKKDGIYIIEDVHIDYLYQLAFELKDYNPIIKSISYANRNWSDLNLNGNLITFLK